MKRVKKIHPEGIKNPDMVPAFFFKALVVWAAKKVSIKKNHTHTHSLTHSKWFLVTAALLPRPHFLFHRTKNQEYVNPNQEGLYSIKHYQVK